MSKRYQDRVREWVLACFGPGPANDRGERCRRFLEEALELCQSLGFPRDEAHRLADYVYDREAGDPSQETGGVKVTLAALAASEGIDLDDCGETELTRAWAKIETIRRKQAEKPDTATAPRPREEIEDPADILLAEELHRDPRVARAFATGLAVADVETGLSHALGAMAAIRRQS